MGIPYAQQYAATIAGAVLKPVKCESCHTEVVYLVRRQGAVSGLSLFFLDL